MQPYTDGVRINNFLVESPIIDRLIRQKYENDYIVRNFVDGKCYYGMILALKFYMKIDDKM